jgi:hypothetical protein
VKFFSNVLYFAVTFFTPLKKSKEKVSGSNAGCANPTESSVESSPGGTVQKEKSWSKSKLSFYQKKYNEYETFIRRGYKPMKGLKGSVGTGSVCRFWSRSWRQAKGVAGTAKTAGSLSKLRKSVDKVFVAKGKCVSVAAALYELYDKDFVWRFVADQKLAKVFPRNVSISQSEFFDLSQATEREVENSFIETEDALEEEGDGEEESEGEEEAFVVEDSDSKSEVSDDFKDMQELDVRFVGLLFVQPRSKFSNKLLTPQGPLANGVKFMLEIGGEKVVSIRNSLRGANTGGLGLFSENHFYPGGVVTFYLGPVLWYGKDVGKGFPTPDYIENCIRPTLAKAGRPTDDKIVMLRDFEGRLWATSPKYLTVTKDATDEVPYLYLGAHYINDPTYGKDKGTTKWALSAKMANVRLMQDGAIVAKREIRCDEELLMVYSEGPDLAYEGQFGSVQSNDEDLEEEDVESVKEAKPKPVVQRSSINRPEKSKTKEKVSKAGSQQMWL